MIDIDSNDANKSSVFRGQRWRWTVPEQDERTVIMLAQKLNIDHIVSRILINRGISDTASADIFLEGKMKNILPNPFLIKDMEKASERIIEAILQQQKVTIFADYDVDGATSAALLYKFFQQLNINTDIYIPNRLTEGYGPNVNAVKNIKASGTDLMITVDCGTSSFEPLDVAHEIGLHVIVIDHHIPSNTLPKTIAFINPHQKDDAFPYKNIAAVAVTFLTIIAIRANLRKINWFEKNNIREPILTDMLDLVALGTVCDVMPLTDLNRIFVKHGLELIAKRNNLGIATILERAKIKTTPKAYHLGYVVGPRINAGGRVSESNLGALLLKSTNIAEAYNIVSRLEHLNGERKEIEMTALAEAIQYVEENKLHEKRIIFAIGHKWHIGIIGIIASRLKDKYNKPVIVITFNNKVGKGSARSIAGIDIGSLITLCKQEKMLIDGGGHAMAGGFSIAEHQMENFISFILKHIDQIPAVDSFIEQEREIELDAIISVRAANMNLIQSLHKLEPFGNMNRTPRFMILKTKITKISVFAEKHLMIFVVDNSVDDKTKQALKCLFFKSYDEAIGQKLLNSDLNNIHLDIVGSLQSDSTSVKNDISFIIEDLILHEKY